MARPCSRPIAGNSQRAPARASPRKPEMLRRAPKTGLSVCFSGHLRAILQPEEAWLPNQEPMRRGLKAKPRADPQGLGRQGPAGKGPALVGRAGAIVFLDKTERSAVQHD